LSLEEESSYKPRASFRGADVNYSDWRDLLLNREWLEQDLLGTALVLEQDLRAAVNQGNEKLEVHPTSLQRLKELIDLRKLRLPTAFPCPHLDHSWRTMDFGKGSRFHEDH
jgi:hypothetical protein